jgi:hypothetical protein
MATANTMMAKKCYRLFRVKFPCPVSQFAKRNMDRARNCANLDFSIFAYIDQ